MAYRGIFGCVFVFVGRFWFVLNPRYLKLLFQVNLYGNSPIYWIFLFFFVCVFVYFFL